MSSSKKTVPGNKAQGTQNKREQAKKQEAAKRKKLRITAIIIVAVCVLLLASALFMNSNLIRRTGTAFKVDGMRFSPAEFTFHYNNYYYDYVEYVYSSAYEYASVLRPDTTQALDAQMYDETKTW